LFVVDVVEGVVVEGDDYIVLCGVDIGFDVV